jgi:hypothetical protein
VAVEKLVHSEFAKIGSRREALQTIFPSLLDIFYHPIFDFFRERRLFQQPSLLPTPILLDGHGNRRTGLNVDSPSMERCFRFGNAGVHCKDLAETIQLDQRSQPLVHPG